MAAKHASVKLSRAFLDRARREAELFNRSVGAQVEHWAELGRTYENAPDVDIARVRAALAGRLKMEDLTDGEALAVMDDFGADFDAAIQEHYAKIGEREGAVGRNPEGELVRRDASGELRKIG